jgi:hypothetical protein
MCRCVTSYGRKNFDLLARDAQENGRRPALDRSPHAVVPESPITDSGVPHQVSVWRPCRWRWLRRRPRWRGSPRSPACRSPLTCRTLPVVTLIPVPVVVVAPRRVPLLTRAPVIAGRRDRRRLGDAAGQTKRRQGQPASRQHAGAQPNPRSRALYSRHFPRTSLIDVNVAMSEWRQSSTLRSR